MGNNFIKQLKAHPVLFFIFILLLCYAFFLRHSPLNIRALEYDEIYTLANFASLPFLQIFTDVATPNNHMLHSFFVKLFLMQDSSFFTLSSRIPCALSGTLTLLLFIPFRKFFQTIQALFFAILLFAYNGAHIHYSQTARGYSLLTFFLLLCIFSLWAYEKSCRENSSRKSLYLYAWSYFISACAASVSVSSGVLFAFAATLCFLLFYFPFLKLKKDFRILYKQYGILFFACSAASVFLLSYYLPNAAKFAKGGRDFGMTFTDPGMIYDFLFQIFYENDLFFPLLTGIIGLLCSARHRKKILYLFFSAFFILLITLLTRGGPPRVYLPLTAFLLPAGALGVENILLFLKEKYILWARKKEQRENRIAYDAEVLLFLFFLVFFLPVYLTGISTLERVTPYDMNRFYAGLHENRLLANAYPVFHPTDSVVFKALYDREGALKLLQKLPHADSLLFTTNLQTLHCTEKDKFDTVSLPLPHLVTPVEKIYTGGKMMPFVRLEKVTKPYRKNEVIFLFVFFVENEFASLVKKMRSLNGFLHLNYLQTIEEETLFACLLAAKADEVSLSPEEMLALEEQTQGRIRFRLLQK